MTVPGARLALCHRPGHGLHRRLKDEENETGLGFGLGVLNLGSCDLNTLLGQNIGAWTIPKLELSTSTTELVCFSFLFRICFCSLHVLVFELKGCVSYFCNIYINGLAFRVF